MLGEPVSVVSITAANVTPGTIATNGSFDGAANPLIAGNVAITAGSTHVYRIDVVVSVDLPAVDATNSDCSLDGGESGTGAMNRASLTAGATTLDAVACQNFPGLAVYKAVTSGPTPTGTAGQYSVTYTLTVLNSGSGGTTYSLDDALAFGAGVTVVSADITGTTPGGLTTNPMWNGVSVVDIADTVAIAAATPGALVEHVYAIAVVVSTNGALPRLPRTAPWCRARRARACRTPPRCRARRARPSRTRARRYR